MQVGASFKLAFCLATNLHALATTLSELRIECKSMLVHVSSSWMTKQDFRVNLWLRNPNLLLTERTVINGTLTSCFWHGKDKIFCNWTIHHLFSTCREVCFYQYTNWLQSILLVKSCNSSQVCQQWETLLVFIVISLNIWGKRLSGLQLWKANNKTHFYPLISNIYEHWSCPKRHRIKFVLAINLTDGKPSSRFFLKCSIMLSNSFCKDTFCKMRK